MGGSVINRRSFLAVSVAASAVSVFAKSISAAALPAPSDDWQIGCYTRPWADHDYRVALDAIAEAGYKYVGLMTTKSPNSLVLSVQTTPDEAKTIGE